MPYIRISIVTPRRGEEQATEEVMRKLDAAVSSAPGCLQSYVLKPHDNSGEIARLTIYENEDAAEAAANSAHILSLRSEINILSDGKHVERAFFTL